MITTEELINLLIGQTLEAGQKICEDNGYSCRVCRIDKIDYVITMDLRFDRINFYIDNGVITKCDIG